jgi:hypothetical protein
MGKMKLAIPSTRNVMRKAVVEAIESKIALVERTAQSL